MKPRGLGATSGAASDPDWKRAAIELNVPDRLEAPGPLAMMPKTIRSRKARASGGAGDPAWKRAGLELDFPARLVEPHPWAGHIPLAFFLVEALRPRILVELGVHTGNSYCALAQAVARLGLKCRCFGIDHWKGDEHSSFYGEGVFQELSAYHDPRYGSFSTLLRMTFKEGLVHVADRSIDLLHIDGFHTYEAVKDDFDSWLPKTSSRAVVLFHDINVHERNFGVWRLWDEICSRYPAFSFLHSSGLGVAYVGSEVPPARLGALLDASGKQKGQRLARSYFARLGAAVSADLVVRTAEAERADLAAQLDEANRRGTNFDEERLGLTTRLAIAEATAKQAVEAVGEARTHAAELLEARDVLQRRLEEARSQASTFEVRAQAAEADAQQVASQIDMLTKILREAPSRADQLLAARNARGEDQPASAPLQERVAVLQQEISALHAEHERIGRITRYIPAPIQRLLKRVILGSHFNAAASAAGAAARMPSKATADVVRGSEFFDAADYRRRATPACEGVDPALHYVLEGERLGIAPSARFNPIYYAERYPDVAGAGVCLLAHYVQHGRVEGRHALPPAPSLADTDRFAPEQETIILVSHDATRTGAPILALNIGQHLKARYNVITVLLGGGDLVGNFEEGSSHLIRINAEHQHPVDLKYTLRSILCDRPIRYAIVNSIASRDIVPVLAQVGIPSVTLIHEFSSQAGPLGAARRALIWTTQSVFSADVTADSFRKDHPSLLERHVHILPQGPCRLPARRQDSADQSELQRLKEFMRPADAKQALLVLGVGTIDMRKGIDLFLASAAAALRQNGKRKLRFVWIGGPGHDPNYPVYLAEQIARSGLDGHFVLLGEVRDLTPAYALADVFYLSSRLDPLPNVTIDAAMQGLPIICFEGATGIAQVLQRDRAAAETVMPYLDADAAAGKIVEMANDESLRQRIGQATRAVAQEVFDMDRYVDAIDEIGNLAIKAMRQRQADFDTLANDPLFNAGLSFSPHAPAMTGDVALSYFLGCWGEAPAMTREAAISGFLAYWLAAPNAAHRRPCPGFHPQIYAEHHPELLEANINPLADFIRKGCPDGNWLHPVIRPDLVSRDANEPSGLRTAIHAHFHYPELIGDFLDKLSGNSARCDLLLTTNDEAKAALLRTATKRFGHGRVEIRVVPNRGRDIGPLLTAYGSEIRELYDVIGHLHAKRSIGVAPDLPDLGESWREFLWQHLLGDRYPMMDIVLASFAKDKKLGLVFADDAHLCGWDNNLAIAEALAARAALARPLPRFFNFPIGTMFWARPQALAPLLELKLDWRDYPEEPVPIDGTILHALERLVPLAAREAGFSYATIHIPGVNW